MKKTTKYAFLLTIIFAISIVYVAFGVEGKIKPYYSGDAVYANGKLIFGSMNNDGVLELFSYSGNNIQRGAVIKASDALLPFSAKKRIYDFALTNEGGKAFVYTVEGKKMSKYSISDINNPVFVNQVLENNKDWYIGLKKYDSRLMTIGTKEVKLWNYSLQNIDNFKILNKDSYNVGISNDGNYIFNIGTTSVNFFDTVKRAYTYSPEVEIKDSHYRKSFYDVKSGKMFMIDDERVNKFSTNGSLTASFKHISDKGYDVDATQGSAYVYASDGLGIVKLNKSNLKAVKWAYTTKSKKGGWAMGLNVVATDGGEKLVVFNNDNILVMDSNLKVLGSVDAADSANVEFIDEPLSLKADRTAGLTGTPVYLTGTGFSYKEDLKITFVDSVFTAKADENGRFKTTITVPSKLPLRDSTDIKVTGVASKLTYSIGFNIQ